MSLDVYLLKQPYEVSFSGNPMPFTFTVAPYRDIEKAQDIRLQVRILVELSFGSNLFTDVKSQTFYPNAEGQIELDIQTIIDPHLDYYLPNPNLQKPVQAFQQRARYKVSYLLIKDGTTVGNVLESPVFYAVKGGMSYQEWHPTEFFSSVTGSSCLPLLFITPGERVGADEKRFIYWLYPYNDNAVQTIVFTVNLSNGSTASYTHPSTIFCGKWGVCCIPAGFTQMSLQTLVPAGLYAVSYSVSVKRGSTNIVLPVTFTIDHRNFYKTYQIVYRNSIGGLDTIRLRGQVDFEADYTMQQAQRIVPPAYFHNMTVLSQSIQDDTEETAKFTGDTGFVKTAVADKLRDLFLSTERYEVRNGKFIPVLLNNKNVKYFSNKDNLVSVQVQWSWAFPNAFYTPEGLMPSARSCPAMDTLLVKQANKNTIQIMYSLVSPYEVAEIQMIIGTTTYTFTYHGNSKSVLQSFINPNPNTNQAITIKGRTVCDEDSIPVSYGPFTTLNFNLTGNSLPVINDDTYTINAGYNSAVSLQGSVLANDYDPDGDPIEVVAATGATNAGGTYAIDAAGNVTYTPPNSSFNGKDFFFYHAREVGSTITVQATVNINVGSTGSVFAKLVYRNMQQGSSPTDSYSSGEAWIDFFSNPAGTQVLDVTGLNLTVITSEQEATRDFNGNEISHTTTHTYTANAGTKVLTYAGTFYSSNYDPQRGPVDQTYSYAITLLAGNGYIVI